MNESQRRGGVSTAVPVSLDGAVRQVLQRLTVSATAQVRAVLRARIVLAAADGLTNAETARGLGISVNTARRWRGRFAVHGMQGLDDAGRSGRPKVYGDTVRVVIAATATSAPPHPATTWTHRSIAEQVAQTVFASISPSQVGRILVDFDLRPHRVRGWLTRRDTPEFWPRVEHICDLYRNPPEGAVLLSVDEKTAIAAPRGAVRSWPFITRRYPTSSHVPPSAPWA